MLARLAKVSVKRVSHVLSDEAQIPYRHKPVNNQQYQCNTMFAGNDGGGYVCCCQKGPIPSGFRAILHGFKFESVRPAVERQPVFRSRYV